MKIKHLIKKIIGIHRNNFNVIKNRGRLKTGKYVSFGKNAEVLTRKNANVEIGRGCSISKNTYISAVHGMISIGSNTFFNRNITIACRERIVIGKDCSFGPGVTIYDHDHKMCENGKIGGYNTEGVFIGNNCWIGANVIILKGSHIGNNSVVAAGTVVRGTVPDNTLLVPETKNRYIDLKEKYETR